MYIRKVKTESFRGLEWINSTYIISSGEKWFGSQTNSFSHSIPEQIKSENGGSIVFSSILRVLFFAFFVSFEAQNFF